MAESTVTTTTVYLETDEYRQLKEIARKQGRKTAAVLREAVSEYTRRHGRKAKPRSVGAGRSGRHDLSERADELLEGMGRSK